MNLRQAAQQALKEMDDHMYRADTHEFYEAKEALRAALAEPEQEPMAYLHNETELLRLARRANSGDFEPNHWTPLYTAPTPRKPLTDLELRAVFILSNTAEPLAEGWPGLERFARAIERAHGIGEQHD